MNPHYPTTALYNTKQYVNTLSTVSNPCYAWETYAARRVSALNSKEFGLYGTHTLQTTLWGYHEKITTQKQHSQLHSITIQLCLQPRPTIMTGTSKPNTRHHNSNNPPEVAMEDVSPINKWTSPNTSKASHKKSKGSIATISLYRDPSLLEIRYGYPTMETIAYEAGTLPIYIAKPIEELIALGYVGKRSGGATLGNHVIPTCATKTLAHNTPGWHRRSTQQHHTITI